MTEFSSAKRQLLREAEAAVHTNASSVGVSCVSDYIELRRAKLVEDTLAAPDYNTVCRIQGAVEELDLMLRAIRKGPLTKPSE